MDNLLMSALRLGSLVPYPTMIMIASRIGSNSLATVHECVHTPVARQELEHLVRCWQSTEMSCDQLAGLLVGITYAKKHIKAEHQIELVVTGPATDGIPIRRTEQVLLDLIGNAISEILIVSFVTHNVPTIIDALNAAVQRGVKVQVLVETDRGGSQHALKTSVNHMRSQLPEVEMFSWVTRVNSFSQGRVHAKVIAVDHDKAFITSANLTNHAMEKNIEIGVAIYGGMVPSKICAYFQALINTNILHRM